MCSALLDALVERDAQVVEVEADRLNEQSVPDPIGAVEPLQEGVLCSIAGSNHQYVKRLVVIDEYRLQSLHESEEREVGLGLLRLQPGEYAERGQDAAPDLKHALLVIARGRPSRGVRLNSKDHKQSEQEPQIHELLGSSPMLFTTGYPRSYCNCWKRGLGVSNG